MSGPEKLHPAFRGLVENLLCGSSRFIQGGEIEICDYNTGDIENQSERSECDRFCLKIPYCGSILKWHVLFDIKHSKLPPDIILDSSDSSFCPVLSDIPSLAEWDPSLEDGLRLAIYQLLKHFRDHQLHIAEQIDHIKFNTEFLDKSANYSQFDVLVRRREGSEDNLRIKVYIQLPVAFSSLPAYLAPVSLGDDQAVLAVTFHGSDAAYVIAKLKLSPRLERALSGVTSLRIPRWGDEYGSCLMDYVPEVCKRLEDKFKEVSDAYDKRKKLVSVFLSHFGSSLIEYDAEGFTQMTFILSYQGFQCLVHVNVPISFPRDPPVFMLQSLYHERNNQPYHVMLSHHSWYDSWMSAEDIVEKTKVTLAEQLPSFRASSLSDGTF
ncbi:BRISC and BRCA1-A complex member 2-like [Corticium candelabrum]|uniref:BRISC and BRCA1-A complex member 2-like n=1 Tax=Corticium candelabrum TaxID=121492 RepID=UPI002E2565CE|nr:BRISC and BRCA1-A complex member 2-like [Corticium candelabrum]